MTITRKRLLFLIPIGLLLLALLVWGGYRYYTFHTVQGYLTYLYGEENVRRTEEGVWEYCYNPGEESLWWRPFILVGEEYFVADSGTAKQISFDILSISEPYQEGYNNNFAYQDVTVQVKNNSSESVLVPGGFTLLVKLQGNYYLHPLPNSYGSDMPTSASVLPADETISYTKTLFYRSFDPNKIPTRRLYLWFTIWDTENEPIGMYFLPLRLK